MSAPVNLQLALLSSAVLGLRHGFDYDHIAAISDITSVQAEAKRAMRLGLLYALGHGATVAFLGALVILFELRLPKAVDGWAERAVGLTLLILGAYVLASTFRGKHTFRPQSRAALLVSGYQWFAWKLRQYWDASACQPVPFNWNYNAKSVFTVGVIHGIGAETPSQLVLFLLAANLGGATKGFLGLAMFLAGLFIMNAMMTFSATGIFQASTPRPQILRLATALTAAYSFVVGAVFLCGHSSLLPPLGS